jgi:hypothetical protein
MAYSLNVSAPKMGTTFARSIQTTKIIMTVIIK